MSRADYAYPNTRIRVMQSYLLGNSELGALTRSKSLNDFIISLKQTRYEAILSKLGDVTLHNIEKQLDADLMMTSNKIIQISPQRFTPLFNILSKKHQLKYIKLILNSKMGNLPPEEIKGIIPAADLDHVPYKNTEEFLLRLIDLPEKDITTLLCERYRGLDKFISDSSDLLDRMIALDRYYFTELQNAVDQLKGDEREIISMFIAAEADTSNLMIILRSIKLGYDARRFTIPCYDPRINELGKHTPGDITDAVKKLSGTAYGPMLEGALPGYTETNSLLQIELTLKRYLADKSRVLMRDYPFQIGYILGFMKLKEFEIENLKAICVGIDEGLPADKIQELLILPA